MGIDTGKKKHQRKKKRSSTTNNNYFELLLNLYKFLARRTDSKFNKIIYH